jgi:hypothetical protein
MATNLATVKCVNFTTCGGMVDVTVTDDLGESSSARSFRTVVGHPENQTCDCQFSNEDLDELIHRARRALQD